MEVLIVDESVAFRRAARGFLQRRGYEVVGEAATAADAITAVTMLQPHAMLVDVLLPDATGFALAAELTRRMPQLAILLTSVHDYSYAYSLAAECGARGFVLKSRLAVCDLSRFWSTAAGRMSA